MKKTIIYGASFNPVHLGHLSLMRALAARDDVAKIVLMPVGIHAFGKNLASGADRLAMLELATQDIAKVTISDFEITKTTTSYTYETLLAYQIAHPQEKITWIIGSENLADLPKWYRYDDLITDFSMEVIEREESELSFISSTKVRERVRKREPLAGWVPPAVEEYIINHRLYR
jgi:nicotinate-nucleotide adenylyltransferase